MHTLPFQLQIMADLPLEKLHAVLDAFDIDSVPSLEKAMRQLHTKTEEHKKQLVCRCTGKLVCASVVGRR